MEEFREIIIKELEKRLGEEYLIIPQDRCKNNGLNLHGICIHRKSENISPIVYLEEFILPYAAGLLSLEKIIGLVLEKCDMKEIPPNLVSHLKEFDMMKDKVGISVINYDANAVRLAHIPHRKFLDLAITYYLDMGVEIAGKNGAIAVTDELMEIWEVTEDDLYKLGITKLLTRDVFHAVDLISLVRELAQEEQNEEAVRFLDEVAKNNVLRKDMYIVSNEKHLLGAGCLLNKPFWKELADNKQSDLIIYPSNIDELIIFPVMDGNRGRISTDDIQEINVKTVPREEQLSNSIYLYDRARQELSIYKKGEPL